MGASESSPQEDGRNDATARRANTPSQTRSTDGAAVGSRPTGTGATNATRYEAVSYPSYMYTSRSANVPSSMSRQAGDARPSRENGLPASGIAGSQNDLKMGTNGSVSSVYKRKTVGKDIGKTTGSDTNSNVRGATGGWNSSMTERRIAERNMTTAPLKGILKNGSRNGQQRVTSTSGQMSGTSSMREVGAVGGNVPLHISRESSVGSRVTGIRSGPSVSKDDQPVVGRVTGSHSKQIGTPLVSDYGAGVGRLSTQVYTSRSANIPSSLSRQAGSGMPTENVLLASRNASSQEELKMGTNGSVSAVNKTKTASRITTSSDTKAKVTGAGGRSLSNTDRIAERNIATAPLKGILKNSSGNRQQGVMSAAGQMSGTSSNQGVGAVGGKVPIALAGESFVGSRVTGFRRSPSMSKDDQLEAGRVTGNHSEKIGTPIASGYGARGMGPSNPVYTLRSAMSKEAGSSGPTTPGNVLLASGNADSQNALKKDANGRVYEAKTVGKDTVITIESDTNAKVTGATGGGRNSSNIESRLAGRNMTTALQNGILKNRSENGQQGMMSAPGEFYGTSSNPEVRAVSGNVNTLVLGRSVGGALTTAREGNRVGSLNHTSETHNILPSDRIRQQRVVPSSDQIKPCAGSIVDGKAPTVDLSRERSVGGAGTETRRGYSVSKDSQAVVGGVLGDRGEKECEAAQERNGDGSLNHGLKMHNIVPSARVVAAVDKSPGGLHGVILKCEGPSDRKEDQSQNHVSDTHRVVPSPRDEAMAGDSPGPEQKLVPMDLCDVAESTSVKTNGILVAVHRNIHTTCTEVPACAGAERNSAPVETKDRKSGSGSEVAEDAGKDGKGQCGDKDVEVTSSRRDAGAGEQIGKETTSEPSIAAPEDVNVTLGCEDDQVGGQKSGPSSTRDVKPAKRDKKSSNRKRSASDKAKDRLGVAVVVNFDAKRLGRRPVRQYLSNVFGENVKFKMGRMKRDGKILNAVVELENREVADSALVALRSSDRNMIVSYSIDLVNCSDLNYELQEKSFAVLAKHDARIQQEYMKLKSVIPADEAIWKELQNKMNERRNVEQKLNELMKQRVEFTAFMGCISHRLIGQGAIGRGEENLVRLSFGVECCRLKQALPMYARRDDIVRTVMSRQVTIVLGETGSGKSTQIVQYLYQAGLAAEGLIACTQPRKVAAVNLAERVSEEMKGHVGGTVGYRSGPRGRFGDDTKILYMTDYTLLMEFIHDSELSEYSCVVIDEAHERSLYTDIILGMLKKLLLRRKELRVIISSATMDTELFHTYFAFFEPTVLEVSGRTFPVEVIWPQASWRGLSKFPVRDAVDKVKEILHRNEERGDVLVFLTTPAETERACELLADNNAFECLPLHGKLQPQDQKKVFAPPTVEKRKVVFATNCAETSITISGIKYVVDTGLVKENRFDPIRNMSTLDVGKTSRSSVEQRKGRAGRIEAGKCFRLFTKEEYNQMDASNKPEILRVQLGQAILSLMSAGVKNPLEFDYVQSPGSEALEAAMADLVSLGAVVDGELTDLGQKISKLKLSPRLGKLVVDGIEQEVAMEALVVASVCTMSGSLFFRMGSEEEKEKADLKKFPFCHPAGDLLTCLEVYRAWNDVNERQKNNWCFKNSINSKAMRIIKETLMELLRTLEREQDIKIDLAFKENKEEADRKIQKSLFSCFKSHLCRYSGHRRLGYLSCKQGGEMAGVLHPSSSLTFLDQKPKWLLYDSILKTSQKFVLNVTAVEDTWVTEAMEDGDVEFNLEEVEEKVVFPTRMSEFGYLVMRKLTENKYTLCNSLQNQMKIIFDSPVFLDIMMAPCVLDITAKRQYHDRVKDIIRDAVRAEKEAIKDKDIQESLSDTSTRLVFGSGYETKLVLGEGEYRSVVVKIDDSMSGEYTQEEILDYFSEFGEIKDHFTFKVQTSNRGPQGKGIRWGKITYSSIDEAREAVVCSQEETLYAEPDLYRGRTSKNNNADYIMKFKYCRRLSKGSGFIRFRAVDDAIIAREAAPHILVGNSITTLRSDRNDDCKLHINKIDVEADEEELRRAVHAALKGYSDSIVDIVLFREKGEEAKPKTQREVDTFKQAMKDDLDRYVKADKRDQYRINIQPVRKPGNVYLNGIIYFDSLDVFEMIAQRLPSGRKCLGVLVGPRPFDVTHHITTSFSVPKDMYSIVEPCFDEVNTVLQSLGEEEMVIKTDPNQTYRNIVRINLSSNDAKSHKQAIRFYQEILDGDSIPANAALMDFALTKEGQNALKHIMTASGAYIAVDRCMRTMSIHGTEGSRTKAKIDLNGFLGEMQNNKLKSIHLQDENQPKGLMKKVVQTFRWDLVEVKAIPGIADAWFVMRKRLLNIRGNEEALDAVVRRVNELADEIGGAPPGDEDEMACSVCFDTFEDDYKNMYRLQICGHAYCLECLKRQIQVAESSKEFPIMCCGENCEESVTLFDIWKIHPRDKRDAHVKLQAASLQAFVTKNRLEYRFCPTPNCQGVYRVTDDTDVIDEFRCELCFVTVCTCCHSQHPGLSCRINKRLKDEDPLEEAMLKKWKAQDPDKRKTCPKCDATIEKSNGCNRMDCTSCETTFCWLCRKICADHSDCYDHLVEVHGGVFRERDL